MNIALKLLALAALLCWSGTTFAGPLKVLIVDGQNNHEWKGTSPILKQYLEQTGLFEADIATTPDKGGDMKNFKPDFAKYQVVVSNYSGDPWSDETKQAFEQFVRAGGGFVSFHAADNSFPEWKEYNRMIGLGGWGGRTEKDGPYVYFKDGNIVRDTQPGRGGSHGKQHQFVVETREPKHPIMAGLPVKWLHAQDELYDRLRGPAENLTVLATAYSAPGTSGSGRNEPLLMTISYGKGRVFHTALGHAGRGAAAYPAMQCVGFIATFQRGTEWAATGKVTQKVPKDFPGADKESLRK